MGSYGRFKFQRNGVYGTGFYQVKLPDNNIATFEADDDGNIDKRTVRVVNPNNLDEAYRGDEIGFDIETSKAWQKEVEKYKKKEG